MNKRNILIVGLGNTGNNFENTRHNIGFKIVDQLAATWNLQFNENDQSYFCNTNTFSDSIYLIKPKKDINSSGIGVCYWKDYLDVSFQDIIVVHDDVALPLGKLKIKRNGGDGGHLGVKNIIDKLESSSFPRVKVGIGIDTLEKIKIYNFVLDQWTSEESSTLSLVIERSINILLSIINHDLEFAMNKFN